MMEPGSSYTKRGALAEAEDDSSSSEGGGNEEDEGGALPLGEDPLVREIPVYLSTELAEQL